MIDLDALSDDALRLIITESATILATCILINDMPALRDNAFSDDDTDYMPARARLLSSLISMLANIDDELRDSLDRLIADESHDFLDDLLCCELELPIDSISSIRAMRDF